MNTAYLVIGGNMGNRLHYLQQAREKIEAGCGKVSNVSGIYETAAWGVEDQNSFLNQALEVKTQMNAPDLLQCLLEIEKELHRKRQFKYGPRTIDIDILFFNDAIIESESLIVPHPQMQNRRFALQCLNDIAAQKTHPVLHKTVQQLLQECTDPLTVQKIN